MNNKLRGGPYGSLFQYSKQAAAILCNSGSSFSISFVMFACLWPKIIQLVVFLISTHSAVGTATSFLMRSSISRNAIKSVAGNFAWLLMTTNGRNKAHVLGKTL